MTFIFGNPSFSLSFDIARNFSTSGRTFPGLQYMISRTSSMTVSLASGRSVGQRAAGGTVFAYKAGRQVAATPVLAAHSGDARPCDQALVKPFVASWSGSRSRGAATYLRPGIPAGPWNARRLDPDPPPRVPGWSGARGRSPISRGGRPHA